MSNEKRKESSNKELIRFDLTLSSNSYIKSALNNWIEYLGPEKVGEWIIRQYNATSNAKRKRSKQDVNSVKDKWIQQDGTTGYKINKTLLETYIYYSSCKLTEKSRCSYLDCTREATNGFAGDKNASLCAAHGLAGMVEVHKSCESCMEKSKQLEKISAGLKDKQKICERYRLKMYRLEKRLTKFQKKVRKNSRSKKREMLSFELLSSDQKRNRLKKAKYFIINNVVGSKDQKGMLLSPSAKEQVYERHIKGALIELKPDSEIVSPLTLKTIVKKVPKVRKSLQKELNAVASRIKHDNLEMCRRWYERKRNFVSAAVARSICESSFVKSSGSKVRNVRVPKEHSTESGLIVREPIIRQTEKADEIVKKFLISEFNGIPAPVLVCPNLFKCRHAMLPLRQFLDLIYASYDTEQQRKYKINFYNEKTGNIIPGRHNMKMCIDGCLRMSCGAAANGGDVKITNIVLQDASYPLSIGNTQHSFLVGSFNCGETDPWIRLAVYLWAQDGGFHKNHVHTLMKAFHQWKASTNYHLDSKISLAMYQWGKETGFSMNAPQTEMTAFDRETQTKFWLCGDLKFLDYFFCGAGQSCSIPFNRFRLFVVAINLTWRIKFEYSDSEEVHSKRVIDGRMFVIAKFMSHRVNKQFFDTNYSSFKKLMEKNTSRASKQQNLSRMDDIFKQAGETVREGAYKQYNNCTAFPRETLQELATRHGITFAGHDSIFFDFPIAPFTDSTLEHSIFGPCPMLDSFFFDPTHNIMGMANIHVVASERKSAISRSMHQGMVLYEYKYDKKSYRYFDLMGLPEDYVVRKHFVALQIAAPSVARSFAVCNDPSKSDSARAAAASRKADGKQAAKLLRNNSMISSSLIYAEETCNGIEKRCYHYLYKHLTRCMAAQFYTTFLFQIHFDELIAEWIGELQHKVAILCGFSVTCNPLVFMRLQPFLMRHHRGEILVDFGHKMALAPKVMGGCEASEAIHSVVSQGVEHWTNRSQEAFKSVVETLRDLHVTVPGCKQPVHPRSEEDMGGTIPPGMTIVEYLIQIDAAKNHDHFFMTRALMHHRAT